MRGPTSYGSAAAPWRGLALAEEAQCALSWRDFSTLRLATAVYYPNTSAYEAFDCVDLSEHVPWSKDNPRQQCIRAGRETLRLRVGDCTRSVAEGTWRTQWVGPLISTGGFDWWQLSWSDVLNLSPSSGFGVLAHVSGPVDAKGDPLGYPPIHQHHMHLVPDPADVFVRDLSGFTQRRLMARHGDWQFGPADGFSERGADGLEAIGQDFRPGGYALFHSGRTSLNVELNDVRAKGAPPLRWYYRLSVLTTAVTSGREGGAMPAVERALSSATATALASPPYRYRALSFLKTHNPTEEPCDTRQTCAFGYYMVRPFAATPSPPRARGRGGRDSRWGGRIGAAPHVAGNPVVGTPASRHLLLTVC